VSAGVGDQAGDGRHGRSWPSGGWRGRIEALVVIGGTTASGKSDLALSLARQTNGVVVNADSQQLFADLPILTASPGPVETAQAPHRLYGLLGPEEQPTVARWLALLDPVLAEARRDGRPVIVVGGTGLYLHGLLHGLPEMPDIPAGLRAELRAWAAGVPAGEAHARLAARDPQTAARLRPTDRQRVLRALEVIEATGRPLRAWQSGPRRRLPVPSAIRGLALVPPPAAVNPRIAARLAAMLDAGALPEVEALLARRPDAVSLPIAKVHGLRELAAVIRGELGEDEACGAIAAQVRRYAKRQRTWLRHQLPELEPMDATGETGEAFAAASAWLGTR
jgi:tRNA dimethylallyltransferase